MVKILSELGLKYIETEMDIVFYIDHFDLKFDKLTKKIYFDKKYFGEIPHVMPDGSICIAANNQIMFTEENDFTKFKNTLEHYIPYLLSLSPEMCIAEMIGEVDYYIRTLLNGKTIRQYISLNNIIQKNVYTPQDLWDTIYYMPIDQKIMLYPNSLNQYSIILHRKSNTKYIIDYQDNIKVLQRVVGNDFKHQEGIIGFIGIGAVSSYIIKEKLKQGFHNFVLADGDIVEQGNLMRYAFPFTKKYKVNAASNFIKAVCRPIGKVKEIRSNINVESNNYFTDCKEIYVSVDSFQSWIDIRNYISNNNLYNSKEITLVGVDIFGLYGKYIHIKSENENEFKKLFNDFLVYILKDSKRSQRVLNGCSKSLAQYNEMELLDLARRCLNEDKKNEVQICNFRNSV